jgi:hypothetical protein
MGKIKEFLNEQGITCGTAMYKILPKKFLKDWKKFQKKAKKKRR